MRRRSSIRLRKQSPFLFDDYVIKVVNGIVRVKLYKSGRYIGLIRKSFVPVIL